MKFEIQKAPKEGTTADVRKMGGNYAIPDFLKGIVIQNDDCTICIQTLEGKEIVANGSPVAWSKKDNGSFNAWHKDNADEVLLPQADGTYLNPAEQPIYPAYYTELPPVIEELKVHGKFRQENGRTILEAPWGILESPTNESIIVDFLRTTHYKDLGLDLPDTNLVFFGPGSDATADNYFIVVDGIRTKQTLREFALENDWIS